MILILQYIQEIPVIQMTHRFIRIIWSYLYLTPFHLIYFVFVSLFRFCYINFMYIMYELNTVNIKNSFVVKSILILERYFYYRNLNLYVYIQS